MREFYVARHVGLVAGYVGNINHQMIMSRSGIFGYFYVMVLCFGVSHTAEFV